MYPPMKCQLQGIKPYEAPYITEGIKLDANENTWPVQEGLKAHMRKWVEHMPINYYPDTCNTKLREIIGEAYGITKEHIICGVGSDQLIDCILRTFVEQGDTVLAPDPSFSMYCLTSKINGGRFVTTPLDEAFAYDTQVFEDCVEANNPKVVFICNPNNPTGTTVEKAFVEKLVQKTHGVIIIDEAYAEFHTESMVDLALKYPNVIVLRTFSKAYGLAGARIGYGIAQQGLLQAIEAVRPPYNINLFSQEAAAYVMKHRHVYEPIIEMIKSERDALREALQELGYQVAPSASNFLWFETDATFATRLEPYTIHLRMFKYQGRDYCRLSVGTPEQNQAVLAALQAVHETKGGQKDA